MAIWAIGDIQGCYQSFQGLLKKIDFDVDRDTLWIAGDLVNRGEGSLETLEYIYSIRDSVKVVLGNHDITLIATYYGLKKSNPTLDPILLSPNASKLIKWLQSQKFLHVDYNLGYCMVHAGISPEFDLNMAIKYANQLEKKLKSRKLIIWLKKMFKKSINNFDENLKKRDKERYAINSFTRMRFCYNDNRFDFVQKGSPTLDLTKRGLNPWFEARNRKKIELKIIFGHWSTLGLYQNEDILSLDTGCLWGRELTAVRIDIDIPKVVQFSCSK